MTDRPTIDLACQIAGVEPSEITFFSCSPEASMFAQLEADQREEEAQRERAAATADRLGIPDPFDHEGTVETRVCERCREPWAFGLEIVGDEALCQPCIDTEIGDGPDAV